jgi:two-component system nitrate/nitrite response regulator NarP
MARILIADDHPIVLDGLALLLTGAGHELVARCRNGDDVMEAFEKTCPDLVLLDIRMPGLDGLQLLRRLGPQNRRSARVVLLTSSIADAEAAEALALGVDGLMLKESASTALFECCSAVLLGRRWLDPALKRHTSRAAGSAGGESLEEALTARERELAALVMAGLRNRQIAEKLRLTEGTVKMYLHTVYQKLGVSSRLELVNKIRSKFRA